MPHILDTHTFIWFIEGDRQLSKKACRTIELDETLNFISIASLWEIAIKVSLNKLKLEKPFKHIAGLLKDNAFQVLPISIEDTFIVSTLPFHNRDPFDRIIIAQSMTNNFPIITKDSHFSNYSVNVIW